MKPAVPHKYVVGIDCGTQSARAILVSGDTGRIAASASAPYAHGVMDASLPSGRALPPLYALQHPGDYPAAIRQIVPAVLREAGVTPDDVAGLCVDVTACTMLPCLADGTPLCALDAFADDPGAYVRLWKHHAAQPEADEITALAAARGEDWLPMFGGRVSAEWMFPKILEVLHKSPRVYEAADRFMEAADWLSLLLTGKETRSAPFAGYKALWRAGIGYPSDDFFTSLDPRLHGIIGTKIPAEVLPVGGRAGVLNARGAEMTGLNPGTPVALPMIDGHAALPAMDLTRPGDLMMIIGTSTCHIINSEEDRDVPGICGYVRDGVIPGLCTYEAGQCAVGDIFDWFVRNQVPARVADEAAARGMSVHALLSEQASALVPGQSGLVALDWWGGNRSVLGSADLSGLILGLNLRTTPAEVYRALLEGTAYGTRRILDQYETHGIPVRRIFAAGGIAKKNPLLMQIYADVTGQAISVSSCPEASAMGAAVYAAAAGGLYPSVADAARAFASPVEAVYTPDPAHKEIYDRIYAVWLTLHDELGLRRRELMQTMTALRREASRP